jgi:DNA-binding NarL/FixJ family response regulator
MPRPCRVLLVDDSPEYLTFLTCYLHDALGGVEVVGTARDGEEGMLRVAELRPDLVIVDLSMPRMNGLEMTAAVKALAAPPAVVMMTGNDGPSYREAATAAGADGFACKTELGRGVPDALRAAVEAIAAR